eukprot:6206505-Pleurochrysis_carterae.AAC.2
MKCAHQRIQACSARARMCATIVPRPGFSLSVYAIEPTVDRVGSEGARVYACVFIIIQAARRRRRCTAAARKAVKTTNQSYVVRPHRLSLDSACRIAHSRRSRVSSDEGRGDDVVEVGLLVGVCEMGRRRPLRVGQLAHALRVVGEAVDTTVELLDHLTRTRKRRALGISQYGKERRGRAGRPASQR